MMHPSQNNNKGDNLVMLAAKKLNEFGILYLQQAIDKTTIARLQKEEEKIFNKVERKLKEKKINYLNQTEPWLFSDVASRSRGRFDIRALPEAFSEDVLLKNNNWMEIIKTQLGENYKVAFSGIVESLGGSADQQWHRDGNHLYENTLIESPYALTCFIPLIEINSTNLYGSPEFIPTSHRILNENDITNLPIKQFNNFALGDAIIFDYRLVHRGIKNLSNTRRPLLYIVYSKQFWSDEINFGTIPLLTDHHNNNMKRKISKDSSSTTITTNNNNNNNNNNSINDEDDKKKNIHKKLKVTEENNNDDNSTYDNNNIINNNDDKIDSIYFNGYLDHNVHKKMLSDEVRMKAYEKAVNDNSNLFKDKIVMDVGAGSGILSLFAARAGAKHVFCIEASNMASFCAQTMKENGFDNVCTVIHDKVENIVNDEKTYKNHPLLKYLNKVDVIISEWMGLLLVQESVLDSVLYARDYFLNKATGVLFPSHARIYIAPTEIKNELKVWDNVCGFHFNALKSITRKQLVDASPLRRTLKPDALCAKPKLFKYFDLKTLNVSRLDCMSSDLIFKMEKSSFDSVSIWFDVRFAYSETSKLSGSGEDVIVLGTGPKDKTTHWEQAVIVLPEDVDLGGGGGNDNNNNDNNSNTTKIKMKCILAKSIENWRHYVVDLDINLV